MPKSWKSLWRLKIPPKVQEFMWRVINDALPSKEQLQHRKISIDPQCDGCNKIETIVYALFECPYAKVVWKKTGLREKVKENRLKVATEVVLGVFWRTTKEVFEEFCILC